MVRSMKTVILPLWGPNGVKNAALEETEHLFFGRIVSFYVPVLLAEPLTCGIFLGSGHNLTHRRFLPPADRPQPAHPPRLVLERRAEVGGGHTVAMIGVDNLTRRSEGPLAR